MVCVVLLVQCSFSLIGEWCLRKLRTLLQIDGAVENLGYGPQGYGQGLNMRDQGFDVILGLRKGISWEKALKDGWVEGENLFSIKEATARGTIIQFLLSDAGQIQAWPMVKENLHEGDALYFSHGLGVIFNDDTGKWKASQTASWFTHCVLPKVKNSFYKALPSLTLLVFSTVILLSQYIV